MNVTAMKDAVKQWEKKTNDKITSATEIKLNGIFPPLDRMDPMISTFVACEKLSLSSNNIERIANLGGLKRLKILSLGRNNIKSIAGIEAVADTLEELWISYNQIDKLKGIGAMKRLRVLTMANNQVREWVELNRLNEIPTLRELVFIGNPLEERCTTEGTWRPEVARRIPALSKLDGTALEGTDICLETATELQRTEEDQNAEEDQSPSTDRSSASGTSSKRVTARPSEDADDAEDADGDESVAVTITAAETGDGASEVPDSQAPESSRLSEVGAPTEMASEAAAETASEATAEAAPAEAEAGQEETKAESPAEAESGDPAEETEATEASEATE